MVRRVRRAVVLSRASQRRPRQICPPDFASARQSPGGSPPIAFASVVVRRLSQGRPPSCFSECVPARVVRRPRQFVVRRPRQGRPPSPPGSPAKLLRVPNRRPRQGRPPSPPGSPAKLVLRESVVRVPVRVVECQSAVPARVVRRPHQGHPPSSSVWTSAVPANVARPALFASAKARSPPARGFSESPTKLDLYTSGWSLSSAVPVRVVRHPRQVRVPKSVVPARFARQAVSASSSVSPPGSSAVPGRVARQARFTSVSSAVPVRVAVPARVRGPRQGRPPSPPGWPAKLVLRVPVIVPRVARQAPFASTAGPARVARRPKLFEGRLGPATVLVLGDKEARFASGPARVACQARYLRVSELRRPAAIARQNVSTPPSIGSTVPACFVECVVGRLRRVVRGPRPGRPPSPPGWPAKLVLRVPELCPARVVRRPRQGRPPSSSCEYQNAGPRQGRSPAPPGSPAKLFEGRLGPARVLALGDKGTQFYYCAPWLAVPNQVWQTRSAWQSKQISKR